MISYTLERLFIIGSQCFDDDDDDDDIKQSVIFRQWSVTRRLLTCCPVSKEMTLLTA